MDWTGWTFSEVNEIIADFVKLSEGHDADGWEEGAQACTDAMWEAMIVRQSMRKARAINLRERLAR